MKVPERISWTVEQLDLQPGDRILELGCGPGVAVSLVCESLVDGEIVAIDRSATAISRAEKRNPTGPVRFEVTDLAGFDAPAASFDKAFAVNVNVFWTGDAEAECEVLARILRPGGAVHLVYDAPSARGAPKVASNLGRHGFTTEIVGTPSLTCITGRV